ncbi:DNA polymerase III subunit delta [Buchnera aphidicola]|uniref:DNA polymerase III subunit delta n=1 Tax=Buchnera aphidicola TaxID=9 RepID=UPI0022381FD4|nr:DNA polymerase III subunit delta [Buchnera aphidicola]MCW5197544.1 DNA polymerase III subunit delta [Buchnera aphidicola (Chaitophorus viminalis)]
MNHIKLKNIIKNIYKKKKYNYIIYGTKNILIQKYQEIILKKFNKINIINYKNIEIKNEKNWENFFYECKKKSFLFKKKIIILKIFTNKIQKKIIEKFKKNNLLFKDNIILLILNEKNYKNIINKNLDKFFLNNFTLIPCFELNKEEFLIWIEEYLDNNLITNQAKFFLYKNYYSNIELLHQNLDIISLVFPNKKITINDIKKIIFTEKTYTIFQWIYYLFLGEYKKSLSILNNLYKKKFSPLSLVRYLENQIIILILIKKKNNIEKKIFLNKNRIWKNTQQVYIYASQNNSYKNFLKIIRSLIRIEISIKKIKEQSIWMILKEISLFFN